MQRILADFLRIPGRRFPVREALKQGFLNWFGWACGFIRDSANGYGCNSPGGYCIEGVLAAYNRRMLGGGLVAAAAGRRQVHGLMQRLR